MPKFIDITGQRFGRLLVLARAANSSTGKVRWNCVCDCGRSCAPQGNSLKSGNAASCGCSGVEARAASRRTHGKSKTPEYMVWYQMHERCSNQNHVHFKSYGGRGISVCERWSAFEQFAQDMGLRPSAKHQLDRIDNDGNYEPSNCHWTTKSLNARNRRDAIKVEFDGKLMPIKTACEISGVKYQTAVWRHRHGLTAGSGLFAPV